MLAGGGEFSTSAYVTLLLLKSDHAGGLAPTTSVTGVHRVRNVVSCTFVFLPGRPPVLLRNPHVANHRCIFCRRPNGLLDLLEDVLILKPLQRRGIVFIVGTKGGRAGSPNFLIEIGENMDFFFWPLWEGELF